MELLKSYGYDNLNRLNTADYLAGTAGTESFHYDLLGNRDGANGHTDTRPDPDTACAYTHNLANEYQTICGVTVFNCEQYKNIPGQAAIYYTEYFINKYQRAAVENLQRSIIRLGP